MQRNLDLVISRVLAGRSRVKVDITSRRVEQRLVSGYDQNSNVHGVFTDDILVVPDSDFNFQNAQTIDCIS